MRIAHMSATLDGTGRGKLPRIAPLPVPLSEYPTLSNEVIFLAAPKAKPARVDTRNEGTVNCDWCCPYNHRGIGGTLTCGTCENTGHKHSCTSRH